MATYADTTTARDAFLASISGLEDHANTRMIGAYARALDRIEREMATALATDSVLGQTLASVFAGGEDTLRIAVIRGRAGFIHQQFARFGADAEPIMRTLAPNAYHLGVGHARDEIHGLVGTFDRPSRRTVEQTIANLSSGTAMHDYFDRFARTSTTEAIDQMTTGVILGHHPSRIVRDMRDHMNLSDARLKTMVRTEVMGAARRGIGDSYRANRDVVSGWIWNADETDRTCPVCWAMNGTKHTVDEHLDSHPNCRCVQTPITKSFAEINAEYGYGEGGAVETSATAFDPDERFRRVLTPAQQLRVLGPGKYALYRDQRITLADLVQQTNHPVWGPGLRQVSLRELRERLGDVSVIDEVAGGVAASVERAAAGDWLDELATVRSGMKDDLIDDIATRGKASVFDDVQKVGRIIDDEIQRRIDSYGLREVLADAERTRDEAQALLDEAVNEARRAQSDFKKYERKRKTAHTRLQNKHRNASGNLDDAYWDEWNAKRAELELEEAEIRRRMDAARESWREQVDRLSKARMTVADVNGQVTTEVLGDAGVEFGGIFQMVKKAPPSDYKRLPKRGAALARAHEQGQQLVHDVASWIPRRWIDASNAYLHPLNAIGHNSRGFYSNWSGTLVASDRTVVIHELMHRSEYATRGIRLLESMFYDYRCRGGSFDGPLEDLVRLNREPGFGHCDASEVFRRDKFSSPYMGKWYDDRAYELVSMGWAQAIYGGEYTLDAEYRAFLMAVMLIG